MPEPFSIQRSPEGNVVVLALEGFLDAHTAPNFEAAVQEEVNAGRLQLLVDVSKLTYISSAGLGVFMGFVEEVREQGGDIKICGAEPKVHEVFELLGFHHLFELLDDRAQGLSRFAAHSES